jgi:Tol biopolymer transport system component
MISRAALFICVSLALATVAVAQQNEQPKVVRSKISVFETQTGKTTTVYTGDTRWEAPNWSPDGKYLLANSGGRLYRISLEKKKAEPEPLKLDAKYSCNNDHGLTRGGKQLAFSASVEGGKGSQVFVANADGTDPKVVTEKAPSYFHGWSPDGKWLAFVAERGDGNFDIYRVSANRGQEERLTSSRGYDDGPDYSPDGKWIYINSDRSGTWDIRRFPADGAGANDAKAERVTSDELEDWFPHPSPDGKQIVFLSFPKGTKGHDGRMKVSLRMMKVGGDKNGATIQTLTEITGGQGTINVNSWSPDSKRFAFVTFDLQ